MRISESWLREWVDTDLDTDGIAEALTLAGLEVDVVEPAAPAFTGVVVARILSVEPHPDADKLRLCSVDAGEDAPLLIVCGAPNAAEGLLVPLAQVGAELPGGMQIKKAKVRGVESSGMLCAAAELGITGQADGLWELPDSLAVGSDLRQALDLDDQIIEIDLTPNRGDCLSMQGVARDLAATTGASLNERVIPEVPAASDATLPVEIENTERCFCYAGRVIDGVDAAAATPLWMVECLRRAGIGSISLPVDVTNYVMLELGQPMHAFDLDKLAGGIQVRDARQGESIVLLDGETVGLEAGTLLITDDNGPVAMAGVMGGQSSAIDSSSHRVFLESACFAPSAVAGQGRRYKIHTDSLHRFERGVNAELQVAAIERATELLLEYGGGSAGPVTRVGEEYAPVTVNLRHRALTRLLGVEIPEADVTDALTRLGLRPEHQDGAWTVNVPGYRYDLRCEADLIEEVARVYGYHRLPAANTPVQLADVGLPAARCSNDRARELFVQRGYHEAISYTFVDKAFQASLNGADAAPGIALDNPIAEQYAVMRTSLWASMLPLLVHNLNRQQDRVRLFEVGRQFLPQDDAQRKNCAQEQEMLAGIVVGSVAPEQWDLEQKQVDIYDVKADLQALFSTCGIDHRINWRAAVHPAMHPGQCAQILLDNQPFGWLGTLHPSVIKILDINKIPVIFEVSLDMLSQQQAVAYQPVSSYPEVRRDLALVVEEAVTADELVATLQEGDDSLLKSVSIFDVYRGKGVEQGFKSVALSLIYQDNSRTLTDKEVEQAVAQQCQKLKNKLGATIRS